jgi:Holliday junction resolvasome RuvABC endonuclease subunit
MTTRAKSYKPLFSRAKPGRVAAFDPGSHAGWAVSDPGCDPLDPRKKKAFSSVAHGTIKPPKGSGGKLDTRHYLLEISRVLRDYAPDFVVSEGLLVVSRQSGGTAYARAVVLVEAAAALHALPHAYVYPAAWRSHFRLPAKADKHASLALARILASDPGLKDHNEAEAILLACYAQHMLSSPTQLALPEG